MATRKKKEELQRLQELEDVRAVMSTEAGSRLIMRLINFTGPFRSTFNPEPARMAFLEGNRNVGCLLVSDLLEACPEKYVRLVVEAKTKTKGEVNHVQEDEEQQD